VFANDAVWPRAFFASQVRSYHGVDDLVSLLEQFGASPFAAVSEENLAARSELRALSESSAPAIILPAHGYRLGVNETSFEIEAPSRGVALLSEAYVEGGFTAEVNGVASEVLRLNHALKGVRLDRAGHYRVTFRYRPPYWALACALFLGAVGAMAAAVGVMIRGTRDGAG
jgi:hypothetical protein